MLKRLLTGLLRSLGPRAASVPAGADLVASLRQAVEKRQAGDVAGAEQILRHAAAAHPAAASAHALLANLLDTRGCAAEAREHYERALQIDPRQPTLRMAYAAMLQRMHEYAHAQSQYGQVVLEYPDWAAAHVNLATALRAVGRKRKAIDHCEVALRLDPVNTAALKNLTALHYDMGNSEQARAMLRKRAAATASDGARIAEACAVEAMADSRGEIQSIRVRLAEDLARLQRESLAVQDPAAEVGITAFYLAYHGQNDRGLQESMAALHRHACPALDYISPHCHRAPSADRIRVGVISGSLYNHSVGFVTEGLLGKLDSGRFSVTAFGFRPPFDGVSRAIAEHAEWVTLPRDFHRARQAVASCELDVIFYPDIGPDPFTYFMAFARLAPVQFTSWGHPVTSGVPTMDYFVSTDYFDTEDAQDHYTERLVRLRDVAFPGYLRMPDIPASVSRSALGFDRGRRVYFCAQSLFKFHPDYDAILAAILSRDPGGEIVIPYDEDADAYRLGRLQARLDRSLGSLFERVAFLPRMPGREGFLHRLQACDVALDTLHYGGGTTGLDAIALGTPTVTMPSAFNRGRHIYGFLRKIGCTETVANSPEEYVDLAVRIATNAEYRMHLKTRLSERAGALYEDRSAVEQIEAFLEQAVTRGRAGLNRTHLST